MSTSKSSVRIRKGEPLLIIINYNENIISKNYFSLNSDYKHSSWQFLYPVKQFIVKVTEDK